MTELTPPFSLIEEIRYEEGQYLAYDINGNFIIELAPEGAMGLVHEYGIKSVGFILPKLRGVLNAMGAFSGMTAGYAIGKNGDTFQEMTEILAGAKKREK